MFKNKFVTAWRTLLRNRSYNIVNILSLAVGMAVAMLIGLWIQFQISYDRYLPGYEQVAQVRLRFIRNGDQGQMAATPLPLSEALRKEAPGIRYAVHTDWMGAHGLAVGDKKLFMDGAHAEGDFFKIFPFPVIKGSINSALESPYSIVLTESTSRLLFDTEDPTGKKVRIDNRQDLIVSAVIKDLPPNSTFKFNYVVTFDNYLRANNWARESTTNWNNNSFQTFVMLQPNTTYEELAPRLKDIVMKYDPEAWKESREELFFHAMKDWHLFTEFKNGQAEGGVIEYVRLFSLIGVLVLLIACVNSMNLSSARLEKRAGEEAMGITIIAAGISLILVQLVLPTFDLLTRSAIRIPWASPFFWGIMALYVIATGLLAGVSGLSKGRLPIPIEVCDRNRGGVHKPGMGMASSVLDPVP